MVFLGFDLESLYLNQNKEKAKTGRIRARVDNAYTTYMHYPKRHKKSSDKTNPSWDKANFC